jgi:anti-anti-sigma regulatory factor
MDINAMIRGALDGADVEAVLDFSAVRRVDPGALAELESLAARARDAGVRVVVRGARVEVYKVLKLAGVGKSFGFAD